MDLTGSTVNPLLNRLASQYQTPHVAMGLVTALLIASISFSQPLFGYLYDRFRAYWLIPLAVVVGGGCLSCVGLIDSFALLLVLIIATGLAVGAFHPGGAALAGRLADRRRPLVIGVFLCAGALGMAAAPLLITRLVDAQGLKATAWLFVLTMPVLIVALLVLRISRGLVKTGINAPPITHSLRQSILSRPLILLFSLATSRSFALYVCVSGMSFLMPEKIPGESQAFLSTGVALCLFGLAMGLGGLISGVFVRPESEKSGIIISLVVGAPLLIAFPFLSGPWLILTLALAGVALNATGPLVIAIGQRMFPQSSALVSSIFMGLAWGISGVAAPLVVTLLGPVISYTWAMPLLIAGGLFLSLLATLLLPSVIQPAASSRLTPVSTKP